MKEFPDFLGEENSRLETDTHNCNEEWADIPPCFSLHLRKGDI